MDTAILYYANQKNLLNATSDDANPNDMYVGNDSDGEFSQLYRKVRTVKKLSSKHKEYFEKLFINGTRNKTKLSAEQMLEKMKDEIVDGKYYFSPAEYLDAKRIKSFISTLTKKAKSSMTSVNSTEVPIFLSEDDGIEQNLEDICATILDSDGEEDFYGFDVDEI